MLDNMQQHGVMKVRQPFVIPRRSRQEEREPPFLHGLQETERHKESRFPIVPD
jgi:hypothetical protein